MMTKRRPTYCLIALTALALVSGCGAVPASSADVPCPAPPAAPTPPVAAPAPVAAKRAPTKTTKPTATAATTTTTPTTAKPGSTGTAKPQAKTPAAPDAAALAAGMQEAVAAMTSYDAVASAVDNRQDGKASTKTTTQIRFQAPGAYRMDVQTSTMPMAAGSKTLLTIGSPNVQVKAGGILGLATLTLPLTDDRVSSLNHWTPDHLYTHTVVERAMAGNGTWSVAGTATVAGTPVTMLKLTTPANALDPIIAYELFAIDAEHRLRLWAAYGGADTKAANGLLYQFTIEKLTVNPTLAAGLFAF